VDKQQNWQIGRMRRWLPGLMSQQSTLGSDENTESGAVERPRNAEEATQEFRKEKILAFKAKKHSTIMFQRNNVGNAIHCLCESAELYFVHQDHLRNSERFAISGEEVEFWSWDRSHVGP